MAVNQVKYGNTTIMDITSTTAEESDVAEGKIFFKRDGTQAVGTMSAGAYSFVGMVVSGTNLSTEADVKAIYGASTSWTLLSSVLMTSEHIFGNGIVLGFTDGTNFGGMRARGDNMATSLYGQSVPYATQTGLLTAGGVGVPTKSQAGSSPENTGLVADTTTVYSWERTA